MNVADMIADLAAPAAQSAGLVVESVDVSAAGKHTRVLVTVDLPEDQIGGADLDVVAAASRAISQALDAAPDTISGAYTLEVSTPGADRPLTEARHFKRARTRKVRIDLGEDRAITGRLLDVVAGQTVDAGPGAVLILATDDGETHVAIADVVSGEVLFEMGGK